ncbi:MAG: hypothetical protein IT377_17375 [Polyangiaceae bacterium]|nr:hypothetical protein [Polyangiaceae bacterium]
MPHRAAFVVAAALLFACEGEPGSPVSTHAQPVSATRSAQITQPHWSAPVDRDVQSRLSAAARAEVAGSPVPVLAPRSAGLAESAIVTTGPVWAAVSATADGVTVAIHTSQLAYRYPDIAPAEGDRTLRGKRGFVTVESNIWQASWHEAGVAHSLHVECAVAGDGRCADDKFLVGLVESLAHVGGRGGAP